MRITDSEMECLEYGEEEMHSLMRLTERVFDENAEDGSNEDLNAIGHLSELILDTAKQLKAIRRSYGRGTSRISNQT